VAITVVCPTVTWNFIFDCTDPLKKRIFSAPTTAAPNVGTVPGAAA
jgi:hypothetical protein